MQDADGDPSHATLTITFEGDNNAPTAYDDAKDVLESGLRGGGTADVSGTVTFDPGLDTPATITSYDDSSLQYGTVSFNTTNGEWTYTLSGPVTDGAGPETDSFTYTVTDSNGSTSTGTITITIIDDVPTAIADTGTATEGETLTVPQAEGVLVNDTMSADVPATVVGLAAGDTGTNSTGTMTVAGTYGTLTIAADGSYSYVANASVDAGSQDVFTYTMQDADGDPSHATLTITFEGDNNAPTAQDGAASQSDAALFTGTQTAAEGTLAFDMGADTPGTVSMVYDDGLGAASKISAGGITTFTASNWVLTINETTGAYSFSQTGAYPHDSGADSASGRVTVTLTDSDGSTKIAILDLTINDMGPTAISPSGAYLLNEADQSFTGKLDFVDGNIEDNIGADQPGTVYFAGVPTGALTSGGLPVQYEISADGMILRGYTAAGDVFTMTLNPNASGQDTYTLNMTGTIDGGATSIDYNSGGYDYFGGNGAWAGFNTVDKKGVDTDPDSNDLLLTPINAGTVNTTANAGGVDNPFVDQGEGMRVDFVIDLAGNPQGHPYTTPANQDHAFDGHYTVNGAGALFTSCTNASVKITAKDDADTGHVPGTIGTIGDGTLDHINAIGISYGGELVLVSYAVAGTTPYDIYLGAGDHKFTITFNTDGTAQVDGVAENTVITTYTADGYNSIEYVCVGEDNFQIGDFGTSVIETGIPVEFSVPVEIMDQDGDTAAGTIDVLLLPENTLYDPAYAMSGTAGDDVLTGDSYDNLIYGGQGDDIISGGDGNDILIGGTGSNTLSGGFGADTFILSEGAQDTILDYSKLQGDKVDISSVLNEGAGDYLRVVANTDGKAELRILDSSDTVKASVSFETINYSDLNDMGAGNELDSLLSKVAIDH
jgi:VCBS repeat-containing protein